MKKILILIMVFTLLLASCGNKNVNTDSKSDMKTPVDTTKKEESKNDNQKEPSKITTAGQTKEKETVENHSAEKDAQGILNKEFQGRFATFKVAKEWKYGSATVLKPDDTIYFYMDKENAAPFFMYQFEITNPSLTSLSEAEWNGVFGNSDAVRVGEEVHNGMTFQYGIAEKLNNQADMLIFYHFDKGVLQAFTMVLPLEFSGKREEYKSLLIDMLNTITINEEAVRNAFDGQDVTTGAERTSLSEEFEGVMVDGFLLPVPKGWMEVTSNNDSDSFTTVFKENFSATEGIMFQKTNLEIKSKLELITYIGAIGSKMGDEVEINGHTYTTVLPSSDNEQKIMGYIGVVNGKTYAYYYISLEEKGVEQNLAFLQKLIEVVKY